MSRTLSSAVPRLTSRGKLSARCGPLTLAAAPPTASQLRRPFFSFPGVGTGANSPPTPNWPPTRWSSGGAIHSSDSDFGRFPAVRWVNPLA